MTNLKDLKIYIVEYKEEAADVFKETFKDIKNVIVYQDDIMHFFLKHRDEIDCLVSPANAFGNMSGGYDARLSDILGWDFQNEVQQYIKDNYYGEQVVGTSFILKTKLPHLSLIHTPTMRYPSRIKDPNTVYHCMRSTLICALKNDITCIVIPVFGRFCGCILPEVASAKMKKAYLQILTKTSQND